MIFYSQPVVVVLPRPITFISIFDLYNFRRFCWMCKKTPLPLFNGNSIGDGLGNFGIIVQQLVGTQPPTCCSSRHLMGKMVILAAHLLTTISTAQPNPPKNWQLRRDFLPLTMATFWKKIMWLSL